MIGVSHLRTTLESVVLSSIMKLDRSSMDKLFDLMIMMVKYQLKAATGPREVILIILNHVDAIRDMVSDSNAQKCVTLVQEMVVDVSITSQFNTGHTENQCDELNPSSLQRAVLRLPDFRGGLERAGELSEGIGVISRASLDSPATWSTERGRQLQSHPSRVQ